MNLLLIAATLRPMVLAPLTSASAIAGYRHLDGRHSAVLQLVKSVADVSERLTRFSIGPSVLRTAADESSLRSQVAKLSKAASDWLHERAPNKKIRYAPASKVWLHWLRPLVMRVLAQTNYYPSLIQLYCTQLLRHLRETRLRRRDAAGPRFKIEEADIESVFSGRPLRDAIRAKFRLTLQLDDRYEVIANAIGLEALSAGFDHAEGIEWRKIRNDCATLWWPEGFASTSERDFLALLEEMVQLGVLSQASIPDHFSLRNPNLLLLLGSKQEIENTLQAEREPRVEFESTIFRPALAGSMDQPARNPLTYRQLDEVMQLRSSVLLVAATDAAGGKHLLSGLRDQPGMTDARSFVLLGRASDAKAFSQELDKEVKKRDSEGITVMMVPAQVPWDADWVAAARTKLNALTSKTSFVSVVFAADPERLWTLTAVAADREQWSEPWLSVLPWTRGFVRKWLEELQLTADAAVERLEPLTGYWGGLLETAASVTGGALDFAHNLDRMTKSMQDAEWRQLNRTRLTGGIEAAERVLKAMCSLGDGVTEGDLVEFGELPQDLVERTLRWAEPLGLVVRAYFSASWTAFQADRGRHFSVMVDGVSV